MLSGKKTLKLGPPFPFSCRSLITSQSEPLFIAKVVIDSDPKTLTKTLHNPDLQWTTQLVDKTLKSLWDHGPKALQFFQILETHPSYTHSLSSFDHAIDIAARLSDYRSMWGFVNRMERLNLRPTHKTFAIIAERYASDAKPERAVEVFLYMHESGCAQNLSSFNSILDVLCKSRHVDKAYNLLTAFRINFQVDLISYNTIVNGWCSLHRTAKALEVLEEMVKLGFTPNLVSYNIMLKGYINTGQLDQAWRFFLKMKNRIGPELDVITYTTLIHGFGMRGKVHQALEIFNGMFDDGVLPTVATYNAMIQVLCRRNIVENAVKFFEDMVSKGYEPNLITYTVLIKGLSYARQMERVVEFMGRMRGEGCEPNVQIYNIVISRFMEDGDIEKGLRFYKEMGGGKACLPNFDTFNILISAMFVRKRSEDLVIAGRLLIEMIERGFVPRRHMGIRVMDGLLLTGNQGFAKEIMGLLNRCGYLRYL